MAHLSAYMIDKGSGTHEGTHLDCIYDVDPLEFINLFLIVVIMKKQKCRIH